MISERHAPWLGTDDACPDWCKFPHVDDDPPEKRFHQSWVESNPPGTWGIAYLQRNWDDTEACVTIRRAGSVAGESEVSLTLDAAEDMSLKLLELVTAERGPKADEVGAATAGVTDLQDCAPEIAELMSEDMLLLGQAQGILMGARHLSPLEALGECGRRAAQDHTTLNAAARSIIADHMHIPRPREHPEDDGPQAA